jgi:hypothetical protein
MGTKKHLCRFLIALHCTGQVRLPKSLELPYYICLAQSVYQLMVQSFFV